MFELTDGREALFQWDTNRMINVDNDCTQLHFSNVGYGVSVDVDVDTATNTAKIPDALLTVHGLLYVYGFIGNSGNGYTKVSQIFDVKPRPKPADYVYTEDELKTYEELEAKIQEIDGQIANLQSNFTEQITNTQNELSGQITDVQTNLSAQVENVHTELSGQISSAKSELEGIRAGYDGTTYETAGEAVRAQVSGLNDALIEKTDELKGDLANILDGNKTLLEQSVIIPSMTIGLDSGSFNLLSSSTNFVLAVPIAIVKKDGVLMVGVTNSSSARCLYLNSELKRIRKNSSSASLRIKHNSTYESDAVYCAWAFSNDTVPDISAVADVEFLEHIKDIMIKGYKSENGLNIIREDRFSHGYVSSSSYEWDSNRISTGLIKVESGETISFNEPLLKPMYLVEIDSNHGYLGWVNKIMSSDRTVTFTNNRDDYVWIYITDSNTNNAVYNLKAVRGIYTIEEINKMRDLNDHISKDVIPSDLTEKTSSTWNQRTRYYAKHYSAIGDSLTAIGSGGIYLDVIDSLLGTTHTNCGIGGTRVSGNFDNAMWQDVRINAMNLKSDFITIMGGSNDVGKNLVVSDSDFTVDNHDTNNFVGAYNLMLSKIYYKFLKRTTGYYSDIDYSGITQVEISKENFFILIITPPKTLVSVDKYNEIILFDQYVTRICDMWGIPVVHAGEEMGMSWMTYEEDANDMVHFGRKWHNRLGQLCVSKLREIEPVD